MGQRYTTCTMYVIQTYESQWKDWCSSGERPGQAPEDWRNKFSVSSALDVINKENMVYCFSSGKFHFFSWHPSQSLWVLCRYCERLSACWDGRDKSYWLWWCTYCLSNVELAANVQRKTILQVISKGPSNFNYCTFLCSMAFLTKLKNSALYQWAAALIAVGATLRQHCMGPAVKMICYWRKWLELTKQHTLWPVLYRVLAAELSEWNLSVSQNTFRPFCFRGLLCLCCLSHSIME